jgi:hypothetical protein
LSIDYPTEFEWKYPAVTINGGKLRISESKFIGLGVDGALELNDVEADIVNTTRFESNDVLSAFEAEGRKKKIPKELKTLNDDTDKLREFDNGDRRIKEVRRYRGYYKNILTRGKTILKAWNVTFIGDKLAKKKTSYKAGYPLWI